MVLLLKMLPLDAAHKTPCVVQTKNSSYFIGIPQKNDVVKKKKFTNHKKQDYKQLHFSSKIG